MEKRVTGIGGIFFKAHDREKLQQWYADHLGIRDGPTFEWREKDDPERVGYTVWSVFQSDTTYFDPGTAPFMVNYRVADLDRLTELLRDEGIDVTGPEDHPYGRFAWITDPEGNRIELWEPTDSPKTA